MENMNVYFERDFRKTMNIHINKDKRECLKKEIENVG